MNYWGLDVHKKVVQAVAVGEDGSVRKRLRFPCTRESLHLFAKRELALQDRLALEATTNTWAVAELLEPHVAETVVSNPMRTRAIAEAKIKTDRVDALVLAQLLRAGFLPKVWIPDARTRTLRQITSHRAALVADRTRLKNRIHAILHQRLIEPPVEDLFGKAGRAFLGSVTLEEIDRAMLDASLRLLDAVESEIARTDKTVAELAHQGEQTRLLMTLPGVDYVVAQTLVATLGDITRFASADRAASYVGLVPRTHQSAEHCYHGPITKQGRAHARWMLVQAAQHVGSHPGPLGNFFRRLARKKNRNVAVVATARKLIVIAWHMLTSNQPYRYALPSTTQAKLARLRVAATGRRRRGGTAKGAPRPANYGSGIGTRKVPCLGEVYAAEGIPEILPAPPGERRAIRMAKASRFVNSIQRSHRNPRASKAQATEGETGA
jgi:transposase